MNRTKVGLKHLRAFFVEVIDFSFESNQGGIETPSFLSGKHILEKFESNQGGIETLIRFFVFTNGIFV